jgi:hypothetical protein
LISFFSCSFLAIESHLLLHRRLEKLRIHDRARVAVARSRSGCDALIGCALGRPPSEVPAPGDVHERVLAELERILPLLHVELDELAGSFFLDDHGSASVGRLQRSTTSLPPAPRLASSFGFGSNVNR